MLWSLHLSGPIGIAPCSHRTCGWNGVELLPALCGQVEPLTGLCNKLWLGEFAGCVPWQCGAPGWAIILAGLQLGSTIIPGWLESQSVTGGATGWTVCPGRDPGRASHLNGNSSRVMQSGGDTDSALN